MVLRGLGAVVGGFNGFRCLRGCSCGIICFRVWGAVVGFFSGLKGLGGCSWRVWVGLSFIFRLWLSGAYGYRM